MFFLLIFLDLCRTTVLAIVKSEGKVTFCGMEYILVIQAARISMMDFFPRKRRANNFLLIFNLLAGTMGWRVPDYHKDAKYLAKISCPKAFSLSPIKETAISHFL